MRKLCAILLICSLLLAGGCARQTMILSEPPGAQVFVGGKEVCTTPCNYDYKTGSFGAEHEVVLHKEGFSPIAYQMKADQVDREARSSMLAAGLVIPGGSLLLVGRDDDGLVQLPAPIVAMHGAGR